MATEPKANKYLAKIAGIIGGAMQGGHGTIKAALGIPARQQMAQQTLQAISQIKGSPLRKGAIGALNFRERGGVIKPAKPTSTMPQAGIKNSMPKLNRGGVKR
jgi:hypothetical protein